MPSAASSFVLLSDPYCSNSVPSEAELIIQQRQTLLWREVCLGLLNSISSTWSLCACPEQSPCRQGWNQGWSLVSGRDGTQTPVHNWFGGKGGTWRVLALAGFPVQRMEEPSSTGPPWVTSTSQQCSFCFPTSTFHICLLGTFPCLKES